MYACKNAPACADILGDSELQCITNCHRPAYLFPLNSY